MNVQHAQQLARELTRDTGLDGFQQYPRGAERLARRLSRASRPERQRLLHEALHDPDPAVRLAAIDRATLGRSERLSQFFREPLFPAALRAIALALLAPAPAAKEEAARAALDGAPAVRAVAVSLLAAQHRSALESIAQEREQLQERVRALCALTEDQLLGALLEHPDASLQQLSAELLSEIGSIRVVDALTPLTKGWRRPRALKTTAKQAILQIQARENARRARDHHGAISLVEPQRAGLSLVASEVEPGALSTSPHDPKE